LFAALLHCKLPCVPYNDQRRGSMSSSSFLRPVSPPLFRQLYAFRFFRRGLKRRTRRKGTKLRDHPFFRLPWCFFFGLLWESFRECGTVMLVFPTEESSPYYLFEIHKEWLGFPSLPPDFRCHSLKPLPFFPPPPTPICCPPPLAPFN